MGTQVLPAQNYLNQPNSTAIHGHRTPYPANNNSHRKSQRYLQKRSASLVNRSPSTHDLTAKHQSKKQRFPAMDLKRVESLSIETMGKRKPAGTNYRAQKSPVQSDNSYAGSACVLSPSPRCLPLPSFFSKKQSSVTADQNCKDTATKDLRRLLRLE